VRGDGGIVRGEPVARARRRWMDRALLDRAHPHRRAPHPAGQPLHPAGGLHTRSRGTCQ
jgi:hypothetical protein